jgi:phytoene dehydrogenase-like protein
MSTRVLIVGAAPGGLAAAMLLARSGVEVTVLERSSTAGGRTSSIRGDGFRFDLGRWLPPPVALFAFIAVAASYFPRFAAASRLHQSWLVACLHPAGIRILRAIQWHALISAARHRPARWKGREYLTRPGYPYFGTQIEQHGPHAHA